MSEMHEKLLDAAARHANDGECLPLWYTDKSEVIAGGRGYASRATATGVANRRGSKDSINAYVAQRTATKLVIWSGPQTVLCTRDL